MSGHINPLHYKVPVFGDNFESVSLRYAESFSLLYPDSAENTTVKIYRLFVLGDFGKVHSEDRIKTRVVRELRSCISHKVAIARTHSFIRRFSAPIFNPPVTELKMAQENNFTAVR